MVEGSTISSPGDGRGVAKVEVVVVNQGPAGWFKPLPLPLPHSCTPTPLLCHSSPSHSSPFPLPFSPILPAQPSHSLPAAPQPATLLSPVDSTATCGLLYTCTWVAPTVARMPTSATPTTSPASSTLLPALPHKCGGKCGGQVAQRLGKPLQTQHAPPCMVVTQHRAATHVLPF